jgi:probable HAF family extracellular repeat protein
MKKYIVSRVSAVALVVFMLALFNLSTSRSVTAQNPTYAITDLGTLPGGNYSYSNAINGSGQVVGYATTAGGAWHPFLWQNGVMADLGTLGGSAGIATDVNSLGQITGMSYTAGGDIHIFLYASGAMQDLGVPTFTLSTQVGINDSGQIVGGLTNRHAFLYSGGVTQDLGTLGGSISNAEDINNEGEVVGDSLTASGVNHTFLYSGGVMQDLGMLATPYTTSTNGINDAGQVVGYACFDAGCNSQHGALWQKDATGNYFFSDLGLLPGSLFANAIGINNSSEIVGGCGFSDGSLRGFVYDSAHGMQDLNNLIPAGSGWVLGQAVDINDSGQIVGVGTINGQTHAYLLTPNNSPTNKSQCKNGGWMKFDVPRRFKNQGDCIQFVNTGK